MEKPFFSELKNSKPLRLSLTFFIPSAILLSMLFLSLILWVQKENKEEEFENLKEAAKAFYDQIVITRIWNAQHGGVYVEVTPETPPNPYLEDPLRDIVSVEGRFYTKINPAYMTRQLSNISMIREGNRFRIISLNPINPLNIADEWESNALKEIEKGELDFKSEIIEQDNIRVFRYIAPLKIEQPCLKCHEKHGYRYGDIKGGISISIPMTRYEQIYSRKLTNTIFSLLIAAIFSIALFGTVIFILSKRVESSIEREIEWKRLTAIVELAGATAHEMRQPLTVVHSLMDILKSKMKDGEKITDEEINIIYNQCHRMDEIIKKMLNITSYKTKDYLKNKKILDLNESSKKMEE